MIIFHNPYDKASRDFVEAYGEGHEILTGDAAVARHTYISAYPSVLVTVPAYYEPVIGMNYPEHEKAVRLPTTWSEVEDFVTTVTQRAITNPPQEWADEVVLPVNILPTAVGGSAWKAEQKELLTAKRRIAEAVGCSWGNHIVQTDRESQSMLTSAVVMSSAFPEGGISWKFADGFDTVIAADILSMAAAVLTHVQTCFVVERTKLALIESGVDPDLQNGWPS